MLSQNGGHFKYFFDNLKLPKTRVSKSVLVQNLDNGVIFPPEEYVLSIFL